MKDLTTTSLRIMLGELLDPMDPILVFLAVIIGGGSFFLRVFLDHGVAYGGLGTVISLLLYLYVSTAVLLFGAELNAELRRNVQKEEALKEERSRRGQEGGREPRVCDSPEGRYPLDSRVVARRQGLVELLEGWWSPEQHE